MRQIKFADEEPSWKKSIIYTIIRRLCERGAIKNEEATVTALVSREEVMRSETEEHIDKIYDGSLKLFFTSFLQKEKLSPEEIEELKKIIEQHGKEYWYVGNRL